jgi:Tfp pilus assembly protein PilF
MNFLVRNHLYQALIIAIIINNIGCAHPQSKNNPIYYYSENERKVAELKSQLSFNPQDVSARLELGKIYLSEGFIKKAIQEFSLVLKIDEKNLPAHLLISSAIQKQRNPDLSQALKILDKALKIYPNSAEVHLNIAQVYQQKKHEKEALNHFQKALELTSDPQILLAGHLGMMSIYRNRGENGKATLEYEAARKIYPQVDKLIAEMEIKQKGATLAIPAEEFGGYGSDSHPSFEKRIELIKKTILNLDKEKHDKK